VTAPVLQTIRRPALLALVTCSALRSAGAQLDTTDRTHLSVTPYAWLSGLTGDVGARDVAVHVDASFADVVKALKFAASATAEARRGPWLGSVDALYVSVGGERSVAIRGDTGSFALTQHQTMIQPTAGYSVAGNAQWALDLLAGARYWNLGVTLDVDRPRASNERSGSRAWVDAVVGARFRMTPAPRVHIVVGGDAGGGGSKSTWQVHGSAGYDVWSVVTVGVAYRSLDVNYDRDNLLFDTRTHGPLIGATFRF